MEFHPALSGAQEQWLEAHHFEVVSFLARGKSSGVWKVKKGKKYFAVKAEHSFSPRVNMVEKEARNLKVANARGIGPALVGMDAPAKLIVMEYIDGIPLEKWLQKNKSKLKLKKILVQLRDQARVLDVLGLNHGQLGGKLHNILVRKNNRVAIIDFEKASGVRKARNENKMIHVLGSGKTGVSQKIRSTLSPQWMDSFFGLPKTK